MPSDGYVPPTDSLMARWEWVLTQRELVRQIMEMRFDLDRKED